MGRGKKGKSLDVGYLINFEISTKEEQTIHHMRNIHILSEFHHENKKFSEIHSYLIFLNTIRRKIPEGIPNYEGFEIVERINAEKKLEDTKLILASLKIIHITGDLPIEHNDITVKKILKFIHENKINNILRLSGIQEGTKTELLNLID